MVTIYFQVNGTNVQGMSHEEVVKILTESGEKVTLVAYREKILNKKMKPMSEINGVNGTKIPGDNSPRVCHETLFI